LWGLYGIIVAIWLAGSQPHPDPEPEGKRRMVTPDLMAFAEDEDKQFNGKELGSDSGQTNAEESDLADEASEDTA